LSYVATEEWTCRLLDRGFTLGEAAAIRGLEQTAIVRHLMLAVRQGRTIAPESFLDPATLALWDQWRSDPLATGPPPGAAIGDPLWPLFLACRGSQ
jgi:ATP-dependent DNA helicase RecQ